MPFRPVNDDHAVQSAVFGISFQKPLSWSSVEALIKSPQDWRKDLPAIELTQAVEVLINPQTGIPQNRMTRGVAFSHKRPDGSSAWQLDVMGTDIRVTTTLYTRWDPTWAKARDALLGVAGQLAKLEESNAIEVAAVSLTVLDVFSSDDHAANIVELFADSEYLPNAHKRFGKLWHSHCGWYDQAASGQTLNQFNIDTRTGADDTSVATISDADLRVLIQHNQVFRPFSTVTFEPSIQALTDIVLTEVPNMHRNNKLLLNTTLSSAVIARINLSV